MAARRLADGGGRALDGEKHGEDGVGDGIRHDVSFPLDVDAAAGTAHDGHAVHDDVLCERAGDFLVCFFLAEAVGGAVELLADEGGVFDLLLADGAKGAFEGPADELHAGGGESQVCAAAHFSSGEAGILLEVFGRHQQVLVVILDEDAAYDRRLLLFFFGVMVFTVGLQRRRDRGEFSNYLCDLIGLEGDAKLLAVGRRVDLNRYCSVCVETKEFGLQTSHVSFLTVNENL